MAVINERIPIHFNGCFLELGYVYNVNSYFVKFGVSEP